MRTPRGLLCCVHSDTEEFTEGTIYELYQSHNLLVVYNDFASAVIIGEVRGGGGLYFDELDDVRFTHDLIR